MAGCILQSVLVLPKSKSALVIKEGLVLRLIS